MTHSVGIILLSSVPGTLGVKFYLLLTYLLTYLFWHKFSRFSRRKAFLGLAVCSSKQWLKKIFFSCRQWGVVSLNNLLSVSYRNPTQTSLCKNIGSHNWNIPSFRSGRIQCLTSCHRALISLAVISGLVFALKQPSSSPWSWEAPANIHSGSSPVGNEDSPRDLTTVLTAVGLTLTGPHWVTCLFLNQSPEPQNASSFSLPSLSCCQRKSRLVFLEEGGRCAGQAKPMHIHPFCSLVHYEDWVKSAWLGHGLWWVLPQTCGCILSLPEIECPKSLPWEGRCAQEWRRSCVIFL